MMTSIRKAELKDIDAVEQIYEENTRQMKVCRIL